MPYSPVKVNQHFVGTYHFHLQVEEEAKQQTDEKQPHSSPLLSSLSYSLTPKLVAEYSYETSVYLYRLAIPGKVKWK
jgi:hypothetical protein